MIKDLAEVKNYPVVDNENYDLSDGAKLSYARLSSLLDMALVAYEEQGLVVWLDTAIALAELKSFRKPNDPITAKTMRDLLKKLLLEKK